MVFFFLLFPFFFHSYYKKLFFFFFTKTWCKQTKTKKKKKMKKENHLYDKHFLHFSFWFQEIIGSVLIIVSSSFLIIKCCWIDLNLKIRQENFLFWSNLVHSLPFLLLHKHSTGYWIYPAAIYQLSTWILT